MPATHANWTVEMLDALPEDGQRYEIIDGELYVSPAPSDVHQLVAAAFHRRLHDYLRGSQIGRAMISPADVRKAIAPGIAFSLMSSRFDSSTARDHRIRTTFATCCWRLRSSRRAIPCSTIR